MGTSSGGFLRRKSELDLVRAQDVGLTGMDDSDVLAWAAANGRIALSHDRATLPSFAYERVAAGEVMPGVFSLHDKFPVGRAIAELLLLIECSEQSEWNGLVVYLPL